MRILDLFAGTGSATKAFEDAGHEVIKVELETKFEAHERDILQLTGRGLVEKYGHFDFVWASPPCQKFSIAAVGHYWEGGRGNAVPKHPAVWEAIDLIKHTIQLIKDTNAPFWIIENPRGMLRKQDFMLELPRQTITYCQYGDVRMKPTDLWGIVPNWTPRPMCKNGQPCHESSPAGTNAGGTGKLRNATLRSMIPYELGAEILQKLETYNGRQ